MRQIKLGRRFALLALMVLGAGGVVSACTDGPSAIQSDPGDAGVARTTVVGPGEDGECDPSFDATCNPDPCFYDAGAPGCTDPCMSFGNPECEEPDPCASEPNYCMPSGGGETPSSPPAGITEDEWNRLNDAEKALCWRNPWECKQMGNAATGASSWAAAQTSQGAHNGPQDALRHAKWNADMAAAMGPDRAKVWADAHETTSSDPAETRMDLHNNEVGRQMGMMWADTGQGVIWAWNNGKLCLYKGAC